MATLLQTSLCRVFPSVRHAFPIQQACFSFHRTVLYYRPLSTVLCSTFIEQRVVSCNKIFSRKHSATNNSLFQVTATLFTNSKLECFTKQFSQSYTSGVKTEKSKLAKTVSIKRTGRKKQMHEEIEDTTEYRNVVAYAVGEELNLTSLTSELIPEGVYDKLPLPSDIMDCLMVTAKFRVNGNPREAFFFTDGGVVCWNMSESERHELVRFAMKHASRPYQMESITGDSENFNVHYDKKSGIVKETIHLKTPDNPSEFNEEFALHKFAFSNALSQSVGVSVSESNLDKFIEQLEPETQRLRFGQNSKLKKRDIEMKQGEVFLLRHEINLETGLLDTPDLYWERDDLEQVYRDTINYLMIPKRIRVINERLTYCSEILSLFSGQINDQHHIRLEWIIIILIFIEVVFGIIHLGDRYLLMKEKKAEEEEEQCAHLEPGDPVKNLPKL